MYAIIETGGKQYRVAPGDEIRVEKLSVAEGDAVRFDRVLLVGHGDTFQVGTPTLTGTVVVGEAVTQGREKKINVIKFKRRKNYLRRYGHRQYYTAVRITDIEHPSTSQDDSHTDST